METIVIKQEKGKNGMIAAIPVLGFAIHALIRLSDGTLLEAKSAYYFRWISHSDCAVFLKTAG